MQRTISCRIFTRAAPPQYPAASLTDYCSGVHIPVVAKKGAGFACLCIGFSVTVGRLIVLIALWIVAAGACLLSLHGPYCCIARIRRRVSMNPKARKLILTESQAACLVALRLSMESKTEIAIQAKLDLKKAAMALGALKELGLARRGAMNSWHPTGRGRNCRFKATPDRIRRGSALPGPGARRLLDVLDRPMQGNELAERLGITLQRVRQLVVKLHAQGLVKFGDQKEFLRSSRALRTRPFCCHAMRRACFRQFRTPMQPMQQR
jgi:hypothetical protein